MIRAQQVAVGSTPTKISMDGQWNARASQDVLVATVGIGTLYLGGDATVSTTTGYALPLNQSTQVTLLPGEQLWAVGSGLGVVAHVLTQGA